LVQGFYPRKNKIYIEEYDKFYADLMDNVFMIVVGVKKMGSNTWKIVFVVVTE
jgi:hypothetical protein